MKKSWVIERGDGATFCVEVDSLAAVVVIAESYVMDGAKAVPMGDPVELDFDMWVRVRDLIDSAFSASATKPPPRA